MMSQTGMCMCSYCVCIACWSACTLDAHLRTLSPGIPLHPDLSSISLQHEWGYTINLWQKMVGKKRNSRLCVVFTFQKYRSCRECQECIYPKVWSRATQTSNMQPWLIPDKKSIPIVRRNWKQVICLRRPRTDQALPLCWSPTRWQACRCSTIASTLSDSYSSIMIRARVVYTARIYAGALRIVCRNLLHFCPFFFCLSSLSLLGTDGRIAGDTRVINTVGVTGSAKVWSVRLRI
jgi:hypothetical protein